MARFLVYTQPSAGHVFPLVPGLTALAARGHDVHVRTGFSLIDQLRSAAPGLTVAAVDARITGSIADHTAGGRRHVDGTGDLLARGPWEAEDLTKAIAEVRPDALLVDSNTYGAGVAAEASGLPWAQYMASVLPLPGRGIPPYGLGLAPKDGTLGRVRDAVGWKVMEKAFGRAILPGLNAMRRTAGLDPLRSPIDNLRRADRLITLTGEPLEYPRADLEPHVRMVGGQTWDPPAPAPDWLLADGDPWVLVTCSTHYQADEGLAVTAVRALRDEPVRVLLTLADAYDTADLPAAPNVRVERFVPHGPVLRHAAAVICPSGMGIVTKAVGAGVPVVAVPFGRDQPEVARRVAEAGAGVVLPARRLEPQRLRAALRSALAMPRRPRVEGSGERFADAAEELVPAAVPA